MEPGIFNEDELLSTTACSSPDMDGYDLSDSSISIPTSLVNAENYITVKEGCQSAFTPEELTIAVEKCKKLVLESEECSDERKWLVRRLIELRHRLEQAKENEQRGEIVQAEDELFVKLGHHFTVEYAPTSTAKKYCDRCCGAIWNVLHRYYQCSDCQYKCHLNCVESLHRVCAHLIMSDVPSYESQICPEVGLDSQGYRCHECKAKISYNTPKGYYYFSAVNSISPFYDGSSQIFEGGESEARCCSYNGHHYCTSCHWNTLSIIPARIRLSWDFEPQKVCRASYQLIRHTKSRPIIKLDEKLYVFIQDLAIVKKMREELALMKQYIATCRKSLESVTLMKELEWRKHLVHSTTMFSLDDLCDIYNETFISKLEVVHNLLKTHIKEECDICRGRGYICEFCKDDKVIFGFDINTYTCPKCESVSHKFCWSKNRSCKRCLRKEKKVEQANIIL